MADFTEADMGRLLLDKDGGVEQPQPGPGDGEDSSPEEQETEAVQAIMQAEKTGDVEGYKSSLRMLFDLWSSGGGA